MSATFDAERGIWLIPCPSWNDFIREVRANPVAGERHFRGQSDACWPLSSMWERWLIAAKQGDKGRLVTNLGLGHNIQQVNSKLDGYLERFKSSAIGMRGGESASLRTEDWWALARHHGMMTPLLDWTRSPYVAAFFAFATLLESVKPLFTYGIKPIGWPQQDVAVWEFVDCRTMGTDEGDDVSVQVDGEFQIFISRVDHAYRQKAQQGVFSKLTHEKHVDLESYLVARRMGTLLRLYTIPSTELGAALGDLDLMNINYSTLFPDLDGAAKHANYQEISSALGWMHAVGFNGHGPSAFVPHKS